MKWNVNSYNSSRPVYFLPNLLQIKCVTWTIWLFISWWRLWRPVFELFVSLGLFRRVFWGLMQLNISAAMLPSSGVNDQKNQWNKTLIWILLLYLGQQSQLILCNAFNVVLLQCVLVKRSYWKQSIKTYRACSRDIKINGQPFDAVLCPHNDSTNRLRM